MLIDIIDIVFKICTIFGCNKSDKCVNITLVRVIESDGATLSNSIFINSILFRTTSTDLNCCRWTLNFDLCEDLVSDISMKQLLFTAKYRYIELCIANYTVYRAVLFIIYQWLDQSTTIPCWIITVTDVRCHSVYV